MSNSYPSGVLSFTYNAIYTSEVKSLIQQNLNQAMVDFDLTAEEQDLVRDIAQFGFDDTRWALFSQQLREVIEQKVKEIW